MKKVFTLFCCSITMTTICLAQGNAPADPAKPQLFGEGVISTPLREWTTTFTPDGKTVYFSQGTARYAIVYSRQVNGKWQKPKLAPFSGFWSDTDPFITYDGKRLYFCSDRPADQNPASEPAKRAHIWVVEKIDESTWSSPVRLDSTINIDSASSWYPSESENGNFYFHSGNRPGGLAKNSAIYFSKHAGGKFSPPVLIPIDTIGFNTQENRISRNDDYMVFVSNRPGSIGPTDLFITFHKDDQWSVPQDLGPSINKAGIANMAPALSPDGRTLYFTNNNVPNLGKPKRVADYDALVSEMNTIYNGMWNEYYVPLDVEGLRAKAVWSR